MLHNGSEFNPAVKKSEVNLGHHFSKFGGLDVADVSCKDSAPKNLVVEISKGVYHIWVL